MINPNECKRVNVVIINQDKALCDGAEIQIVWRGKPNLNRKRLYLKFSIMLDGYYLSDRN